MIVSNVTLHKLRLFQLVYESGSFNKSAERLNLSQAAISQHIKGLEAALSVQLFIRSPQGVRPTPAGDLLHLRAAEILRLADQIPLDLAQLNEAQSQQLILGATPGAGAYMLPIWLGEYQRCCPEVSVTTKTEMTEQVVASVLDGEVDFGVTLGSVDDFAHPQLEQHTLWWVDYIVVVPPTHAWATVDGVTPSTLRREPFIARQQGSRSRQWLLAQLGDLNICAEMDSPFAVKQAIFNGIGISILPSYTVERELARGELVALDVEGVELKRPLMLLWRRDVSFNEVKTSFWQMLRDYRPKG